MVRVTITAWNPLLLDQLTFHWDALLRPRLDGLTDEEYLWEPVDGCWSVRPVDDPRAAPIAAGSGGFRCDFAIPEPTPATVTTIAWRLAHLLVGVLGQRNAAHFGGPPVSYETYAYAGTAAEAVARLDAAYAHWTQAVRDLGEDGLAHACGPAEGPFGDEPLAVLVLHIHREVLHHGAEILLLRDLYRCR